MNARRARGDRDGDPPPPIPLAADANVFDDRPAPFIASMYTLDPANGAVAHAMTKSVQMSPRTATPA